MLLVNLSQDKSIINSYISNTLIKWIENTLKDKKKVILYINKRWEFSSLICNNCNYLYKCDQCDTSMSVHKYPQELVCHICKNTKIIPTKCEKCWKESLQKVWIWIQQIEDSIKKVFPNNKIFRFDADNVKNKKQKNLALEILNDSEIIIWTKMITTWFDFLWVWLIWVILLEQELLIPNYNTEEKLYSNIKQLIWRWSRNWEKSEIIIQTFIPKNQIVQNITQLNYKEFFIKTLQERKLFNYPPYSQMLTLEYRNKDKQKAEFFMKNIKNKLDLENKDNKYEIIFIPNPTKKYNQYYYKIIIKWELIRNFISKIKPEIMKNSSLVVIFE